MIGGPPCWLDEALADVADDYDLILFDTPPAGSTIHLAAATAAHYVLVPTAPDRDSIEGLAGDRPALRGGAHHLESRHRVAWGGADPVVRGATAVERRPRGELRRPAGIGTARLRTAVALRPAGRSRHGRSGPVGLRVRGEGRGRRPVVRGSARRRIVPPPSTAADFSRAAGVWPRTTRLLVNEISRCFRPSSPKLPPERRPDSGRERYNTRRRRTRRSVR